MGLHNMKISLKRLWSELLNTYCVKYNTYQSVDGKYIHELIGILKQISNLLLSNDLLHKLILSEGRRDAFHLNEESCYKILCFRQSKRLSKVLGIGKYITLGYDKRSEQFLVKKVINGNHLSLFDRNLF